MLTTVTLPVIVWAAPRDLAGFRDPGVFLEGLPLELLFFFAIGCPFDL
jgi:hypothetical protein